MEIRDAITACSAAFSIAMAMLGIGRAKKEAAIAGAVDRVVQDAKIDGLEKRIERQEAELSGLRIGLDAGMGRLQDSVAEINKTLGKMETKIAVLVDRDEHPRKPTRSTS